MTKNYVSERLKNLDQATLINLIVQSKHVDRVGKAYRKPNEMADDVRDATASLRNRFETTMDCAIQLATEWVQAGGSLYTLVQAAYGEVHLPTKIENRVAVFTEVSRYSGVRSFGVMMIDLTHVRVAPLDVYYAGPLADYLYRCGRSSHVAQLDDKSIRNAVRAWLNGERDLNGRVFHTHSYISPHSIRWGEFTKKELALFILTTQHAEAGDSIVFGIKPGLEKSSELPAMLRQSADTLRTQAMDCALRLADRGGNALGNAVLAITGKIDPVATLYTRPL